MRGAYLLKARDESVAYKSRKRTRDQCKKREMTRPSWTTAARDGPREIVNLLRAMKLSEEARHKREEFIQRLVCPDGDIEPYNKMGHFVTKYLEVAYRELDDNTPDKNAFMLDFMRSVCTMLRAWTQWPVATRETKGPSIRQVVSEYDGEVVRHELQVGVVAWNSVRKKWQNGRVQNATPWVRTHYRRSEDAPKLMDAPDVDEWCGDYALFSFYIAHYLDVLLHAMYLAMAEMGNQDDPAMCILSGCVDKDVVCCILCDHDRTARALFDSKPDASEPQRASMYRFNVVDGVLHGHGDDNAFTFFVNPETAHPKFLQVIYETMATDASFCERERKRLGKVNESVSHLARLKRLPQSSQTAVIEMTLDEFQPGRGKKRSSASGDLFAFVHVHGGALVRNVFFFETLMRSKRPRLAATSALL